MTGERVKTIVRGKELLILDCEKIITNKNSWYSAKLVDYKKIERRKLKKEIENLQLQYPEYFI